ncbi:carbohydrate-binding protein [Flavobacterium sp. RHBU_24]|uniref:carbohydrate-binding protein n=1 Tax=Flavobacterium sp. RHBU_24 TaxID=3391185 RepID=UPI003984DDD3
MKKILCALLVLLSIPAFSQGFLHQQGQQIVDGNGNPILLRGLGLGGWMVQEGYMLQTASFAGSQHEIRQKITDLIGAANTETFYQKYRDNGITKRDIDSLKAWGFNSVRLPMHYNLYTLPIEQEPVAGQQTWLDEGFERTDALLQWCADNQMYLILDMHAAPGGQGKDANISDYDPSKPSLWESEANKTKMIALWRRLADRYKDSPWIGAYDLINEPNWAFTGTNQNGCDENSNTPLRNLMVAITQSIREVDTNHMVIIEGNCWGNNYNGIFPLWDDNMTMSFHKYWNGNDQGAIQGLLNLRNQHNVPLWLGESGENSNVWFRDAIKLVESLNIGWAWWPMKKVESIAGPADVTKPAGYQALLDYWGGTGAAPSVEAATATLMQLAENYKLQNTTIKRDVIDAMFRQVQTDDTKKYKPHPIPGKVYATEYDLGTNGFAYKDNDVATYHSGGGTYTAWNQGWAMRNDGVDIQASTDSPTNGFQVGYTAPAEWLVYTLTAPDVTAYDIDIRYAGSGKIHFEDAAGRISETITLPNTGGWDTWGTASLTDVLLKAGDNKVKLYIDASGFNLNYFELKNPTASTAAVFKVIDAGTNALGDKITVSFNKSLATGIDFNASGLSFKINGNVVGISGFTQNADNSFTFTTATPVSNGDVVTLTYAGTNIIANDGTAHDPFTDKPVTNRVGNVKQIPGTVQAEDFYANNGLELEATTDTGGGQNIGYTSTGDYLDYLVNIQQTGNYKIEYRYACGNNTQGQLKLQLINAETLDIETVTFGGTGGWQTWQTKLSQAQLPAGRYYLRALIMAPEFNLNWIRFTYMDADADFDGIPDTADLCPNTPDGSVVDFNGCVLYTLPQNNFAVAVTSETCRSSNNGSIAVTAVANHNYTATLTGTNYNQSAPFTVNTTFSNLQSGNYQLCITLAEAPAYRQCFDVFIDEPTDLAVLSRVAATERKVELDLYGGEKYTIDLNGESFVTYQNTITLNLNPGENNITVTTDKECQGIYRKAILLDATAIIYPNPLNGNMVYIAAPNSAENSVSVQVFNTLGESVYSRIYEPQNGELTADLSNLSQGVYMIRVVSGGYTANSKLVKQ